MRKINLNKLSLAILVIAGVITAGCVSTPKETMKIKVGFLPIVDCLQLYVAQEKGFFEGEGLEIEAIPTPGGTDVTEAVESGEFDVAWIGVVPPIVYHSKGSDIKLLTPGAFSDPSNVEQFQLLAHHKECNKTQ